MRERPHLLILGGTAEARLLAARVAALFGERLRVTTSLAGRTRSPVALAGAVRSGGFGGAEGLGVYLREAAVDFVVDATHPFAARISAAAISACRELGVPLLVLARPRWRAQPGDRWVEVASATEAAAILATLGRRAFLTIGQRDLAAFAEIAEMHFVIRLIEPPAVALPLRSYELILARGPFTVEGERFIMTHHAIDVLVAKASGGVATAPKLDAARALGIPVVMLRRPEEEHREHVDCVEEVLAWIEHRLRQAVEVVR